MNEVELRDLVLDYSHFSEKLKSEKYGKKYPEIVNKYAADNDFYDSLTIPRGNIFYIQIIRGQSMCCYWRNKWFRVVSSLCHVR